MDWTEGFKLTGRAVVRQHHDRETLWVGARGACEQSKTEAAHEDVRPLAKGLYTPPFPHFSSVPLKMVSGQRMRKYRSFNDIYQKMQTNQVVPQPALSLSHLSFLLFHFLGSIFFLCYFFPHLNLFFHWLRYLCFFCFFCLLVLPFCTLAKEEQPVTMAFE